MSDSLEFGVCRLSIVPVYEQPDYRSKQYNQLLFGEHYSVTGYKGNWISIQLAYDLSGGWIYKDQHHSISKEYFDQINISDYKITTDVSSTILYNKIPLNIVLGSVVPISNSELFKMEEQLAFNGETKSLSQKRDTEFLKSLLSKYSNTPYQPGGKSPFGIDSSGLTQMAYKICGYRIPRTAEEQLHAGKEVTALKDSKMGDIVFLRNNEKELISAILVSADKALLVEGFAHHQAIEPRGIRPEGHKRYTWNLEAIRRII